MGCDCQTYICASAYINPCSEGTETSIVATFTGMADVVVFFNGNARKAGIQVVEGAIIVLPTGMLNENYVHKVEVYNNGTIEACYKLHTYIADSAVIPLPPTEGNVIAKEYVGNGNNVQTFTGLGGNILLYVVMNGQSYTKDFWIQVGSAVTWKDPSMTFEGSIILNWY